MAHAFSRSRKERRLIDVQRLRKLLKRIAIFKLLKLLPDSDNLITIARFVIAKEPPMTTLTLEQIAAKARKHTVTPAERRAQRVSLIMGLRSKNSSLTREDVQSFLDENEGHETGPKKRKK